MHLFLLDFQVILGFQGNRFYRFGQALLGLPGNQGDQEDQVALECYCDIQKVSG